MSNYNSATNLFVASGTSSTKEWYDCNSTTRLLVTFNDLSSEDKLLLRGNNLTLSFDYEAEEFTSTSAIIGFSMRIAYTDGSYTAAYGRILAADFSQSMSGRVTTTFQIEDKEIDSITSYQPYFYGATCDTGTLRLGHITMQIADEDLGWSFSPYDIANNSLAVGGVNLLDGSSLTSSSQNRNFTIEGLNSATVIGYSSNGYNFTTPSDGNSNNGRWFSVNFIELGLNYGDTVTFSCYLKGKIDSSLSTSGLAVMHSTADTSSEYGSITTYNSLTTLSENDFDRFSMTFTIPSYDEFNTDNIENIGLLMRCGYNAELWVKDIQLEKGDSLTDWSLSLNDLSSSQIYGGQITVSNVEDGKTYNAYLRTSSPLAQVYDQETKTYSPDFTTDNLIIYPEVFVSGNSEAITDRYTITPTWTINGSSTLIDYGAVASTTSPYALTISKNLLTNTQLNIECLITYLPEGTTTKGLIRAQTTITKKTDSPRTLTAIVSAPYGNTFVNDDADNLTVRCDLYRGNSIDDTNVYYTWYYMIDGGDWVNAGVSGRDAEVHNVLSVSRTSFVDKLVLKCEVEDLDPTYTTSTLTDTITINKVNQPYKVVVRAPKGSLLKSSQISTDLTAYVVRGKSMVSDSFYNGVTFIWSKRNRDGSIDSSFSEIGRTITVSRDSISRMATYSVSMNFN